MAWGPLARTLIIAMLGVHLAGCSTLMAWFHRNDNPAVTTASPNLSSPDAPAAQSTGRTGSRISRLTERAGVGAHDAGRDAEDLWDRIRIGFKFTDVDRPEVHKAIGFYANYN